MSKRKPAPAPPELTAEILSHRRDFERFVLEHAEPWHRAHLGRLFVNWRGWNGEHFEGRLEPPYLFLAEPAFSRHYGCCGALSGFGGRSEIRIRPSLVRGSHPHVLAGEEYAAGRDRFVDDVLLHEMVHQWQFEILGDGEPSYHGHGPLFRDVANRIGKVLGLSRVRDCKRRGADRDLPNCAQWPHCVRPEGFYLGAYRPRRRRRNDLAGMIARFLRQRIEQDGEDDVLPCSAVESVLEAVASAVKTVSGSAGTDCTSIRCAARLLIGSGAELVEVQE